jgi:hypothetical protein
VTREQALEEIAETANAMIRGHLSYIEGARKLAALRFPAELEDDADLTPFVGIDSETDALPLDRSENCGIRQRWRESSLR